MAGAGACMVREQNPGGLGWFSEAADNCAPGEGRQVMGVEFWGGHYGNVARGHRRAL